MLKQKEYNISESNIANLGTDLEKKIREEASNQEKAWATVGQNLGLDIWRIEKFKVVPWPKNQYGTFFSGDSYIVLHTYKKKGKDAISYDVHFWLGRYTTQDEAGTAAYKTVELDDHLKGLPVQHREVQGYESDLFLSYFNNQIKLLDGGVDSGFKHVEPEKYTPRLLHLKGKRRVRITQVPLSHSSMNSGDVFILDAGLTIYQWNGKSSGPQERVKAAQISRALDDERKGLAKVVVLDEGNKDVGDFWKILGGEGPVKSAAEGGSDEDADRSTDKKLFHLSDASGKLVFKLVSSGKDVKRTQLDSNDVFILDNGSEVFAWIGKGASVQEKKKAMHFATDYLTQYNRPLHTPISRILEGGENEVFEASF